MWDIRQRLACGGLGLLLAGPLAHGATNNAPPPSARGWRVSALLQYEEGLRAGIVDDADGKVFFIGVGETKYGAELLSADFEREELVLRQDGYTWRLHLEADPSAAPALAPAAPPGTTPPPYRGAGIEAFLRDHPEARVKGSLPTLSAPPPSAVPAEGFGEGIERFLREHPELEAQAREPIAGIAARIDEILRQHPDILGAEINGRTLSREAIEHLLRENPRILEYLRRQTETAEPRSEDAIRSGRRRQTKTNGN